MVCPKCGAEMAEGHLYCEKCGAEVQIVPVFEPELEESIRDTMRVMAQDVAAVGADRGREAGQTAVGHITAGQAAPEAQKTAPAGERAEKEERSGDGFFQRNRRRILAAAAVAAVLAVVAAAALIIGRNYSAGYQVAQARKCMEAGAYAKALPFLEKAADLEPEDTQIRLHLAEVYGSLDNQEGAVLLLNEVVTDEPDNEEAYRLMIASYEKQGKYDQIDRILKKSENEEIRREFSSYMALPPKFSQEDGSYQEKISLRIMADTAGEIYYNLDGRPASTDSLRYRGPLELDEGTHVVSAVFVNAYGIVSDSVTKTYEIELPTPDRPAVFPAGGSYTRPIYIRVETPEECEIHYTSDGSIPTEESPLYEGPLAMPLGESLFAFVAVSEYGKTGDVAEVRYDLNMSAPVTSQAAELAIKTMMIAKGRIIDYEGHAPDLVTLYDYRCTAAVSEGARNYYIVEEFKKNRVTGNIYAVDADTGDLYETVYNSAGKFEFKYFF